MFDTWIKYFFKFNIAEPSVVYELPYEREVGVNPTIDQMQELVAHENRRPIIKEIWHDYPVNNLHVKNKNKISSK